MAWLAVGSSNEDLCEQLIENGILENFAVRKAFQLTDRGDFVQQNFRSQAYFDRPFKQGFIHISAPHMYATVLEALDMRQGMSFLNVGSGSGYLSCLAACILGESGLSHGIDVNAQVVAHSIQCCKVWFEGLRRRREEGDLDVPKVSKEGVSFVHGNCFHLDIASSVNTCRYDRIYVGAGCPESRKEFFYSLLADDGILVASINERNELIQVKRRHRLIFTEMIISHVIFAPLLEPTEEISESIQQPITFPMLQIRRQRSGTMSSVTTNASSAGTSDMHHSRRRSTSSVGAESDAGEETALMQSSLSSSPPSNGLSLAASPLSSLLADSHVASLLRAANLPNSHFGISMSVLSSSPPSASHGFQHLTGHHPNGASASASSSSSANGTPNANASSASIHFGSSRRPSLDHAAGDLEATVSTNATVGSKTVTPIRLPPVLWAPVASRHAQFPPTFKRAVLILLMASRRPVSIVQIVTPGSTNVIASKCLCGAIPMNIWVHILSFASRDWFVPDLTENDMMMGELSVQNTLRQVAETMLRQEQQARRQVERERDIFQMMLRRMRSAMSSSRRLLQQFQNDEIGEVRDDFEDNEEDDFSGEVVAEVEDNDASSYDGEETGSSDSDEGSLEEPGEYESVHSEDAVNGGATTPTTTTLTNGDGFVTENGHVAVGGDVVTLPLVDIPTVGYPYTSNGNSNDRSDVAEDGESDRGSMVGDQDEEDSDQESDNDGTSHVRKNPRCGTPHNHNFPNGNGENGTSSIILNRRELNAAMEVENSGDAEEEGALDDSI